MLDSVPANPGLNVAPQQTQPQPDRPLRVALASYRSHPFVGGQGVYVAAVSRALVDLGHQVTVISGPPLPDLDSRVNLVALPSLDLFSEKNALFALKSRHLSDPADLAEWALHNTGAFGEVHSFGERLYKWIMARRTQFDVVHDNQGLSRGLRKLNAAGIPVISTLHHPISVDLDIALTAERSLLNRLLLRRWHGFIATQAKTARALAQILTVSQASKQRAIDDFGLAPEQLTVSANGVDHAVFFPRANAVRDPDLIVTTASADTPLKGLAVLIRAFATVRKTCPNARLVVIGRLRDGQAKDALAHSNLAHAVSFRSELDQNDIADLFCRCSIAVFPSLFEGFGLPAAEAMACAACVVTSDGGGLPEVVGDTGAITPAGDHEALAETMIALLNNPVRRMALGAQAAVRAQSRFSWDRHAQSAVALYRRVCAHAHHSA